MHSHRVYVSTWYVSVAVRKTATYSYNAKGTIMFHSDSFYEYDLPIYDALKPPLLQLSSLNFQEMCPVQL